MTTNDVTQFTPEERQRVRNALASLPYGGLALFGRAGDPENVPQLVHSLEGFAHALRGVAERSAKQEAELSQLKRDLAGFRRILGTATCGDHDRPAPCVECQS